MSITFASISEKVHNRERLSVEEGIFLFEKADLLELGQLANFANQRLNRFDTYYNVNRHINPTNVCAKTCKFCAFSRKPGEEGAYELSIPEILEKARDVVAQGATEVHMVGGLHPRWRFDHYLQMINALKTTFPDLHVKAFTAVEIDWLAAKARLSVEDTLMKLKEAGLGSLPGGGAEIFHPEIRLQICDTKTDAERWLNIHRTAHRIGMRSNCTMLYGHIENHMHRVDHMERLRSLQDETGGFNVFIPLAFQPEDNDMGITRYTVGADDLRVIAVARLFLDNFRNIKAYWIMLGQDIAQLALNFGANDLDGTVTEEKISRMAGGRSGMAMAKAQIQNIIRKAGKIPVERDTLYKAIQRDAADTALEQSHDATQSRSELILYKAVQSEHISADEAKTLIDHTPLLELAHTARALKHRALNQSNSASFALRLSAERNPSPKPDSGISEIAIDLAAPLSGLNLENGEALAMLLTQSINAVGAARVTLLGMKALWRLSKDFPGGFEALMTRLRATGLQMVESSAHESEEDLTLSEVTNLHRLCHQHGIQTIAKLEISATYGGVDQAFWDRFVAKAFELRKLVTEENLLAGIAVEPGSGSMVTPCEYLRAVAMARIIVPQITHILTPFKKIPTIRGRLNDRSNITNDPAFKILPLVTYFGASDYGYMLEEEIDAEALRTELMLSRLEPRIRNASYQTL